jgi:hypothetical protein
MRIEDSSTLPEQGEERAIEIRQNITLPPPRILDNFQGNCAIIIFEEVHCNIRLSSAGL